MDDITPNSCYDVNRSSNVVRYYPGAEEWDDEDFESLLFPPQSTPASINHSEQNNDFASFPFGNLNHWMNGGPVGSYAPAVHNFVQDSNNHSGHHLETVVNNEPQSSEEVLLETPENSSQTGYSVPSTASNTPNSNITPPSTTTNSNESSPRQTAQQETDKDDETDETFSFQFDPEYVHVPDPQDSTRFTGPSCIEVHFLRSPASGSIVRVDAEVLAEVDADDAILHILPPQTTNPLTNDSNEGEHATEYDSQNDDDLARRHRYRSGQMSYDSSSATYEHVLRPTRHSSRVTTGWHRSETLPLITHAPGRVTWIYHQEDEQEEAWLFSSDEDTFGEDQDREVGWVMQGQPVAHVVQTNPPLHSNLHKRSKNSFKVTLTFDKPLKKVFLRQQKDAYTSDEEDAEEDQGQSIDNNYTNNNDYNNSYYNIGCTNNNDYYSESASSSNSPTEYHDYDYENNRYIYNYSNNYNNSNADSYQFADEDDDNHNNRAYNNYFNYKQPDNVAAAQNPWEQELQQPQSVYYQPPQGYAAGSNSFDFTLQPPPYHYVNQYEPVYYHSNSSSNNHYFSSQHPRHYYSQTSSPVVFNQGTMTTGPAPVSFEAPLSNVNCPAAAYYQPQPIISNANQAAQRSWEELSTNDDNPSPNVFNNFNNTNLPYNTTNHASPARNSWEDDDSENNANQSTKPTAIISDGPRSVNWDPPLRIIIDAVQAASPSTRNSWEDEDEAYNNRNDHGNNPNLGEASAGSGSDSSASGSGRRLRPSQRQQTQDTLSPPPVGIPGRRRHRRSSFSSGGSRTRSSSRRRSHSRRRSRSSSRRRRNSQAAGNEESVVIEAGNHVLVTSLEVHSPLEVITEEDESEATASDAISPTDSARSDTSEDNEKFRIVVHFTLKGY